MQKSKETTLILIMSYYDQFISDFISNCSKFISVTPEERKARLDGNKPDFLVRLKDTELLENTYLRFMIKVKGDPNPELKL